VPKRRIDVDVLTTIHELAVLPDASAGAIHKEVERRHGEGAASLRTVHRVIAELRQSGTGGPWLIEDTDSQEEAKAILAVLAHVQEKTGRETEGRYTVWPSRDVARLIAGIWRAAPNLARWPTYMLALLYQSRRAHGASTTDLDYWLAFAPWRSPQHRERYDKAADSGWIRRFSGWRGAEVEREDVVK
jgi:hypothetical protein